jgi:D-alanyl-D-alanine carboxypeptidase (penicillin-binding protein 5/6)
MIRRIIAIVLIILAIGIICATLLVAFTPGGQQALAGIAPQATPTVAPLQLQPAPKPTPVLTITGKPAKIAAQSAYLLDAKTGRTLFDFNGEEPRPMASTTKIMTAIIAIQSGNLNMLVTIHQDAYNEWFLHDGSNAQLVVGDRITLKDLLYALLLPSGDDAAIAIADAIAGSPANFVNIMNIYAYRLHLYQTHYINPDGLTYYQPNGQPVPGHYTTAYDLVRLATYAMQLPLFAQIVKTLHYTLPATATHHAYNWTNTNNLLGPNLEDPTGASTYTGAIGIKTGFTLEAGYCLVFAAKRAGQYLIGVVLFSTNTDPNQRYRDATVLLNWGFGLPLRVPER